MPSSAAAEPASIPAIMAPPPRRDNRFTRSTAGLIGLAVLGLIAIVCLGTLPWTFGMVETAPGVFSPRFDVQNRTGFALPPAWWWGARDADEAARIAAGRESSVGGSGSLMGTDLLGRDVFIRVLAGGGISLGIGLAAALLSVFVGTFYGAIAGAIGGRTDAVMMRIVDVLYGLPYILLVVLLAVASGAAIDEYISRSRERAAWVRTQAVALSLPDSEAVPSPPPEALLRLVARGLALSGTSGQPTPGSPEALEFLAERKDESGVILLSDVMEDLGRLYIPARRISPGMRTALDLIILLVAIGGVSWLTMARVVRGQVLSLKNQPFMEAARAMGTPVTGIFLRHLLPNLVGPIIVYATLTVPQAILQESFLSFLGIGVRPPLPSWGNLAADGLVELNPYKSRWWLLLFPCLALGITLLALNFVGEGLREALDPRRGRGR